MDEGPVRRLLERGEATEDDLARVGGDRGVGPREGVERRQLARPGIAHIETVVLGRGVPFGHRTRDEELGGREPDHVVDAPQSGPAQIRPLDAPADIDDRQRPPPSRTRQP